MLFLFPMLIPLFARVTAFKVENAWRSGPRGLVRCTTRLSRRLRSVEAERVKRLLEASVGEREVVHECRPEEIEEWHNRLADALAGARIGAEVRAAIGERRPRRVSRKPEGDPPDFSDPAA